MTAWRMPHLPYEELPPLADYDYAEHLKARSFGRLDPMTSIGEDKMAGRKPQERRHIFWGLLRVLGM